MYLVNVYINLNLFYQYKLCAFDFTYSILIINSISINQSVCIVGITCLWIGHVLRQFFKKCEFICDVL